MEVNVWSYFWIIFPVFWICMSYFISRVSGWSELAKTYATQNKPTGTEWRFRSVRMRFTVLYSACINFSATKEGLFVWLFLVFRPGHPPLFIPWSDVEVCTEKQWFRTVVRIQIGDVPIVMNERLANEIRQAAGHGWPEDR